MTSNITTVSESEDIRSSVEEPPTRVADALRASQGHAKILVTSSRESPKPSSGDNCNFPANLFNNASKGISFSTNCVYVPHH